MPLDTTDRIIDAAKRREMVPYSDMHIWRLEKQGRFPERIKLGQHRVGWSLREILQWIEERKAERHKAVDFEAPNPQNEQQSTSLATAETTKGRVPLDRKVVEATGINLSPHQTSGEPGERLTNKVK